MRELSLFTGAGGGVYASLLLGHQLVGYVEHNEYCQKVIRQRITDGIFHDAPIFGDIREFDGSSYRGSVDIISGGFPCQPFSIAGRKKGVDDSRNMWPETIRVIKQIQPKEAFLENVPGLLHSGYFGTILNDLSEAGYDAKWITLSAGQCGAPHKRERLWILANARCEQRQERTRESLQCQEQEAIGSNAEYICEDVPHSNSEKSQRLSCGTSQKYSEPREFCQDATNSSREGLERQQQPIRSTETHAPFSDSRWWEVEPDVGRVVDGLADRKHRLTALGNGQVSIVARNAYLILTH